MMNQSLRRIQVFLTDLFEKADLRLMIFILLCLNFLSFTLSSNEEAYFPLAKQFMDPRWIPDSFTFTEWPGNRVLFQYISGWALKFLSFEQLAFWGRLLVFGISAFPLARLFNKLKIGNLAAILLFQLYLVRQNYFAGEFIVGDFEAKSLAYIMILFGLNSLLDRKFMLAALWAILASWFHVLVGGWFFVLVVIYTFFFAEKRWVILKQGVLFGLLMAPYAVYLFREIFSQGSVIQGVNIDQVYVFFRNPHHTAPLSVKEHLLRTSLQILATAILFGCTLFWFSKKKGPVYDELYLLNVIILTILFVSLGISLIDHQGTFLKFYPFRLAALGMLLMYLYLFKLISGSWQSPPAVTIIAVIGGFYLIASAGGITAKQLLWPDRHPEFEELQHYVVSHTAPSDVFLPLADYDLSFSRKTRREVFVNFKFDPGGGRKIYEWYMRIRERNRLNSDPGYVSSLLEKYRISYILSDHLLPPESRMTLVFHNTRYSLYKIQ
jgi:hypothetical protein